MSQSKVLEAFYTSLNKKKLIESELLEIIEKNPQFIYDELQKADAPQKFVQIFKPYLEIIEQAISNRKKQFADGIIYNGKGEILMLLRASNTSIEPGKWGLPGGHIDRGETPDSAVIREVLEETGLVVQFATLRHVKETKDITIFFYFCDVNPEQLSLVLDAFEHKNYKWVDRKELQTLDCIFDLKEVLNEIVFTLSKEPVSVQIEKSSHTELLKSFDIIKTAYENKQISEDDYLAAKAKVDLVVKSIDVQDKRELKTVDLSIKQHEDKVIHYNEMLNDPIATEEEKAILTRLRDSHVQAIADLTEKEFKASTIIEYLKNLAEYNMNEKQKAFFEWQYKVAKQVIPVSTQSIKTKYQEIDRFLANNNAVMKQSFSNAAKLAMGVRDVEYVEGFINNNGIPIEHAWNKINGEHFDITNDITKGESLKTDYVEIICLNSQEVTNNILDTERYGCFIKLQFEKEHNIAKAEQQYKIGDTKNWHGKQFKLTANGWSYADERKTGLSVEKQAKKMKIQDFTDEDLDKHAERSSISDLQRIIKDGRNPRLRDAAIRHLATRKAKENEHSLYDLMLVEDVEGDHQYVTDENTIHFDKQPDDDVLRKLDKHGIKYLVNSKEIATDTK